MKTFIIETENRGFATYYVQADTKEEALEKYEKGDREVVEQGINEDVHLEIREG